MNPITATIAATAALKAVGTLASAQARASSLSGEAAAARLEARDAAEEAGRREDAARRVGAQTLGAQAAAAAQSGLGLGGTNAMLLRQTGAEVALDALEARHAGASRRASGLTRAAELDQAARQARVAGAIGSATEVLQGVGGYLRAARPLAGPWTRRGFGGGR
jgi:hypothetical protein